MLKTIRSKRRLNIGITEAVENMSSGTFFFYKKSTVYGITEMHILQKLKLLFDSMYYLFKFFQRLSFKDSLIVCIVQILCDIASLSTAARDTNDPFAPSSIDDRLEEEIDVDLPSVGMSCTFCTIRLIHRGGGRRGGGVILEGKHCLLRKSDVENKQLISVYL